MQAIPPAPRIWQDHIASWNAQPGLALHPLAWACVALPLIAVHLGYALSIFHGTAPACLVYLQGCVSVSGAVREAPSIHLYRALALPAAGLTFLFWILAARWVQRLGGPRDRWMLACGLVGTAFLVLYAVMLGTDGALYAQLRRYGIWFYFGLTFVAELLLTRQLLRLELGVAQGPVRVQDLLCRALLIIGLLSVPTTQLLEAKRVANALEWTGGLCMLLIIGCVAEAWRRSGFRAELERN